MANFNDLIGLLGDGKSNAIHAPDLEDALDIDTGPTQEPTRDLIRESIIDQKIPIGSTTQVGYFLIDTEEELTEVIEELQQRINGVQRRIDGITAGWNSRKKSRESSKNWPK